MLNREADYGEVKSGRKSHLPVEIDGQVYAMKLVKDNTRFIFLEEDEYLGRRNLSVIDGEVTTPEKDDLPTESNQENSETPTAGELKPPAKIDNSQEPSELQLSFSDEELFGTAK